MKFKSLKSRIFKTLLKGSDLSLLNSPPPLTTQNELSLKEKILSSETLKNLYAEEFAYLNHFMDILSYSEGSGFFGMIDFPEPVESNSDAIRGRLFSHESKIKELFIIANEVKYPFYAFRLSETRFEARGFDDKVRDGIVGH